MRTMLAAVALCALGVGPAYAGVPKLARDCNAIPWVVPVGAADDVPAGLRKIQTRLIRRPRGSVEVVIESMPHSLHLRRIAPAILARQPGDKTRRAILGLLQDPDVHVAREAANSLGHVGGIEVHQSLESAVRKREDAVKHNAINALARVGAVDKSVTVLLHSVGGSPSVAMAALDALSCLRGTANQKRAIERIETLLETGPPDAVAASARAALRVLRARQG